MGLEPLPLPSAQLAAQVRGRHLLGIVTRTRPPAALRRRAAFDISTVMDGRVTCVIAAAHLPRPAVRSRMAATMTPLRFGRISDDHVREAAWVARCVGRADTAPLGEADLAALASYLTRRDAERGRVLFAAGKASQGVWIVRGGMVELAVGAGDRRVVVELLHPGDVDGDVELLLGMPFPYTARAATDVQYLFLSEGAFERLLRDNPTVARRWLSSVAARVASGHKRIVGLLGKSLPAQVARLLAEEAVDWRVGLPQRTLAAMLGVQRPSLNKVLKQFERQRLVEVGYGEIRVLEPERLARLVG